MFRYYASKIESETFQAEQGRQNMSSHPSIRFGTVVEFLLQLGFTAFWKSSASANILGRSLQRLHILEVSQGRRDFATPKIYIQSAVNTLLHAIGLLDRRVTETTPGQVQ